VAQNRVLSLDGEGDYVEITDSESLNAINSQVTMEAWIKPTAFLKQWIAIIHKGDHPTPNYSNRSYVLFLNSSGFIHLSSAPSGQGINYLHSPSGLIKLNTWYHIAGVVDAKSGVMKIFLNGIEVASRDSGRDIYVSKLPLRIGNTPVGHANFAGQTDEVHLWNIARTQEEIKTTMHSTLSGKEPGLVGYWRFDDDEKLVIDSSPTRSDGQLQGDAQVVEMELPEPGELTTISGEITDDAGKPVSDAVIILEQDGKVIAQTRSGSSGSYHLSLSSVSGKYDLSATNLTFSSQAGVWVKGLEGELGAWQLGIRLREGEHREINLRLKKAISITGRLLMLDDTTPHVAVLVQVVRDSQMVGSTLSNSRGEYQFANLKPGQYQMRCQIPGEEIYYQNGKTLSVGRGKTLSEIDFRFPPFKKGAWKTYTHLDGLADNMVLDIEIASDSTLWFGTSGGVSRFDGNQFVNFTQQNGLVGNAVVKIQSGLDGVMWFGGESVFRHQPRRDSDEFVNVIPKDALPGNPGQAFHLAPDGALWVAIGSWGTNWQGVCRYDGFVSDANKELRRKRGEFKHFTTKDGLAGNMVFAIESTPDGNVWIGTNNGVSRYDGTVGADSKPVFTNFTSKDGLVNNWVLAIHVAPDGTLWFGTYNGVSRYDGNQFLNFTIKDGLANNTVSAICSAPDGTIWFGTGSTSNKGNGVSCYDGKGFVNYTTEDGLASNWVSSIYCASDGVLWVGTYSGGVSCYDQKQILNLTTKDGLAGNDVTRIHRTPDGVLWFGTNGDGISRYAKSNGRLRLSAKSRRPEQSEGSGRLRLTDGKSFLNLTQKDGLAADWITFILHDSDGNLWFGTRFGGLSRYDGKKFTNFTEADGLASKQIIDGYSAPDGALWFATAGNGISRYDGNHFVNFSTKDGLANNYCTSIAPDSDGNLWFGTYGGGVSRYDFDTPSATQSKDGNHFVNFTTTDGLVTNYVWSIYGTPDGMMWFGTSAGGASLYDGKQFLNFTEGGMTFITSIHRTSDDVMWFGTYNGVLCYDGITWMSLDAQDGLASSNVFAVCEDEEGYLWFGTEEGVTCYRRSTDKPRVRLLSVQTDQVYTDLADLPPIITGHRMTIKYSAIDFKTHPRKRQYRCRLNELDGDWRPPTKSDAFEHIFTKAGVYNFSVQAIDRDLNYSEPASLTLKVVPPWYLNGWIAIPSAGGILALLIWAVVSSVRVIHHRRQIAEQERQSRQALETKNQQIQALNEQLQDDNLRMAAELEITERIQRMILPSADELQSIVGLDIAGYMEPADDVGGDYYDVMQREGMVAISIGDVTGHGLESGLVMLMTQTAVQALLHSGESDPVHFLDTLNRTIYNNVQRMASDKNLTLCLLDYQSGELKLSGQHEEMIVVRRDGTVELIDTIDLGFPIGLDDDIADFIDQTTVQLQPGDGVVLYTDGITEAENTDGEQYGLERLCEVVSQHWSQSAEAIKEAVIAEVRLFIGEQEVYDDITLVVLKQK